MATVVGWCFLCQTEFISVPMLSKRKMIHGEAAKIALYVLDEPLSQSLIGNCCLSIRTMMGWEMSCQCQLSMTMSTIIKHSYCLPFTMPKTSGSEA